MKTFIILFFYCTPASWSCRPDGSGPDNKENNKDGEQGDNNYGETDGKIEGENQPKPPEYFPSNNSWGGWTPPEDNDNWKMWIELWNAQLDANLNPNNSDSNWEEWKSELGSGFPDSWKGFGPGIDGVPPPPWAHVPESYDKPEYCFYMPVYGKCKGNFTRWGFNPGTGQCQEFPYSGCGGNDNNFASQASCAESCLNIDDPDCDTDVQVDFEEMTSFEFDV